MEDEEQRLGRDGWRKNGVTVIANNFGWVHVAHRFIDGGWIKLEKFESLSINLRRIVFQESSVWFGLSPDKMYKFSPRAVDTCNSPLLQ
jgi:hypothetical protein